MVCIRVSVFEGRFDGTNRRKKERGGKIVGAGNVSISSVSPIDDVEYVLCFTLSLLYLNCCMES